MNTSRTESTGHGHGSCSFISLHPTLPLSTPLLDDTPTRGPGASSLVEPAGVCRSRTHPQPPATPNGSRPETSRVTMVQLDWDSELKGQTVGSTTSRTPYSLLHYNWSDCVPSIDNILWVPQVTHRPRTRTGSVDAERRVKEDRAWSQSG